MVGQPLHPQSREHVRSLLAGFRLLEAAGACELVASQPPGAGSAGWWRTLAGTARAYRVAMADTAHDGYLAIRRWAEVRPDEASETDWYGEEVARLSLEYEHWLEVVPGGGAYVAWLRAFVATVELDGRAAVEALRQWSRIASDFLDPSDIALAPSVYDQLQCAANLLEDMLCLPEHPLRDKRRFALLPPNFPN